MSASLVHGPCAPDRETVVDAGDAGRAEGDGGRRVPRERARYGAAQLDGAVLYFHDDL
ncbi:MAG: hypothetical protein R2712_22185 [Vicinamibacterales bacterium]